MMPMPVLIADLGQVVLGILMFLTALFLVLLVLVQRGRGGGLTGALGGVGGQSAFGTKAGDVFTKITIGAAVFWIFLCLLSIILLTGSADDFQPTGRRPVTGTSGASDSATTPSGLGTDAGTGGISGDTGDMTGTDAAPGTSGTSTGPASGSGAEPAAPASANTSGETPPATTP